MKKRKIKAPPKSVIVAVVILLALLLFLGYIWNLLNTSEYFEVREVITKEPNHIDLSYLKGRNIFTLDLKEEAGNILTYYPNCLDVQLSRVLPNRLYVKFIKRKPAALVKLYRNFILDEQGVIFPAPNDAQYAGLPVVTGLETRIIGPRPGRKYNIKEVKLALEIIKEIRENTLLKNYRIEKIDLANTSNTTVYLMLPTKVLDYQKGQVTVGPDSLEIRLGDENIKDKITILSGVFVQTKVDLATVKYVDLRFKEPVIKLKDAQQ